MQGEDRFYPLPLARGIRVQLGAVFIGDNAITAREHVSWPEHLRHDNGRTLKLYIKSDSWGRFYLDDLDVQLESLGIVEDYFDWTFMREQILSYEKKLIPVACFRNRERDGNPSPHIWGFGRPHPFDLLFRPNQLLAGPVVDHRPTSATTPSDWKFEPVWMCSVVVTDARTYFLKLESEWYPVTNSVSMIAVNYSPGLCEDNPIPEPLLDFARKNERGYSSWSATST